MFALTIIQKLSPFKNSFPFLVESSLTPGSSLLNLLSLLRQKHPDPILHPSQHPDVKNPLAPNLLALPILLPPPLNFRNQPRS